VGHLNPAIVPASVAELSAYFEELRPGLYACAEAMEALRLTFDPPVPAGSRLFKLALRRFNGFAFSTLPYWARGMYGRPGGPLTDATAGLRVARVAASWEPVFRVAMHAVGRAEGRRA
jgi:uncharacterized protein (DUF2236 family)